MRNRASVLIGLLWCLALLSVLVIGVLHIARTDLRVTKNYGDSIQAHYLALAGVEKAKALLFHDAATRRRSVKNHTGELYNAPEQFRDVRLGRGEFRVIRGRGDEPGADLVFGISDEESRLNVNTASAEELGELYQLPPDVAAAIIDYRDQDNSPGSGGAEVEYYVSLKPPYLPRNGPFQTIRELLMVRGVSVDDLLGEDMNQNGLLDPNEDDGNDSEPPDNSDGILQTGWAEQLTLNSASRNANAAGEDRVNVQSADENALARVPGISSEIAKAIVASRNQNRIESLSDLLEVRAVSNQPNQQPSPAPDQAGNPVPGRPAGATASPAPSSQPASTSQSTGPKLISEDLLLQIADDVTTSDDTTSNGLININTATVPVLMCLPSVTRELAQAIISYRQSSGFFSNVAWLLRVPGMNQEIFKQLAPKVCTRSETFRILSEGKVPSTGTRKRMCVTVRVTSTTVDTLSYREDL